MRQDGVCVGVFGAKRTGWTGNAMTIGTHSFKLIIVFLQRK